MKPYCIITDNIRPPVPSRRFDWVAYCDGYEERRRLYGYGATREEAVAELMECIEEDDESLPSAHPPSR